MEYVDSLTSKNERIVIKTRKHWVALLSLFMTNILFGVVILGLVVLIDTSGTNVDSLAVLLIFPLGLLVRDYLRWWNEQYLVTNRRVIQSMGIFNKRVIDSSLEKVNDVVLTQSLMGRMMDYGDIEILTASEIGVNDLRMIRNPVGFKTEMINQKEKIGSKEYLHSEAQPSSNDIPGIIELLDELRRKGVLTDEEFQTKKTQLLSKM